MPWASQLRALAALLCALQALERRQLRQRARAWPATAVRHRCCSSTRTLFQDPGEDVAGTVPGCLVSTVARGLVPRFLAQPMPALLGLQHRVSHCPVPSKGVKTLKAGTVPGCLFSTVARGLVPRILAHQCLRYIAFNMAFSAAPFHPRGESAQSGNSPRLPILNRSAGACPPLLGTTNEPCKALGNSS